MYRHITIIKITGTYYVDHVCLYNTCNIYLVHVYVITFHPWRYLTRNEKSRKFNIHVHVPLCTVEVSHNAPAVAHTTLPKSHRTFDAWNVFVFLQTGMVHVGKFACI